MFKKLIPVIIMALLGTNPANAATAFDVGVHGPLATLSLKTGHNHKPHPHPKPHPRPLPHPPTRTEVIVGGIVAGVIVIAVVTVVLANNRHAQEDSSDQDTPKPRGDTTESETEVPENKPPQE